jgi:Tfp pilus assembly protein PilO
MIIATLAAGAVLLAALWMLALSPKRSENAEVSSSVAAQEQRLGVAKTQLVGYQTARKQYPGMLAELRRLDKAVPARGAIPSLLRQLQRRAKASKSNLQVAALRATASAPVAGSTLTPGATLGAGGIATLPFTFTYTGAYFDLVHVLAAARHAVAVKSGDVKIGGRLVTIEGMSFQRAQADDPLIRATISATAYIAAAPPAPQPTAIPAATTTQGGS